MAKMTKAQMLTALAEKTGHTKKEVASFMDTLAEWRIQKLRRMENLFFLDLVN